MDFILATGKIATSVRAIEGSSRRRHMTRAAHPTLIEIGDIERVFSDEVIKDLASTAKLPNGADIDEFGNSVRIAVDIYLKAKARLNTPQLRKTVTKLYRLNRRAESGGEQAAQALSRAIAELPVGLREQLDLYAPPGLSIPDAAEFVSPAVRREAVRRLAMILSHGGSRIVGRRRAGDRRSQSFKPFLNVPTNVERKRPHDEAGREFVRWLALAYLEATGELPPHTAHYDDAIIGPFPKFARRCFELAGAPGGNVTRLVNEYGNSVDARPWIGELKIAQFGCHPFLPDGQFSKVASCSADARLGACAVGRLLRPVTVRLIWTRNIFTPFPKPAGCCRSEKPSFTN